VIGEGQHFDSGRSGIPKDATPVEKTKHKLCELFIQYRKENDLTQAALAKEIFAANRDAYHPIARGGVERILGR